MFARDAQGNMRESTADDEERAVCHDGNGRVTFHSLIPRHDVSPGAA